MELLDNEKTWCLCKVVLRYGEFAWTHMYTNSTTRTMCRTLPAERVGQGGDHFGYMRLATSAFNLADVCIRLPTTKMEYLHFVWRRRPGRHLIIVTPIDWSIGGSKLVVMAFCRGVNNGCSVAVVKDRKDVGALHSRAVQHWLFFCWNISQVSQKIIS